TIDSSPSAHSRLLRSIPDRYLQPVANPVIEGARTRNGTLFALYRLPEALFDDELTFSGKQGVVFTAAPRKRNYGI
ncbi:hypothetical protein CEXT_795831, partial [Caerostris extrusa]